MNNSNSIVQQQKTLRGVERSYTAEHTLSSTGKIRQNANQFIIVTEAVVNTENNAFALIFESEDEVFEVNQTNSSVEFESQKGFSVYKNTSATLHNGNFEVYNSNSSETFFIKYLQVTVIETKPNLEAVTGLGSLERRFISDHLPDSMNKETQYWQENSPQLIFSHTNKSVRSGLALPSQKYEDNYSDPEFLKSYYKLRGFEFGKWTTQEDRLNFMSGIGLALYDLSKVLNLSRAQIGLDGELGIAFGSRGTPRTRAHFEPHNYVINLTRQKDRLTDRSWSSGALVRKQKMADAYENSGIRSFTHEFGHALDFFAGEKLSGKMNRPLTGRELGHEFYKNTHLQDDAEGAMQKLMLKICLKGNESLGNANQVLIDFEQTATETYDTLEFTSYYQRVWEAKPKARAYWCSKVEIFARCFEVYVYLKLKEKGYFNVFLSKGKHDEGKLANNFDSRIYPTENEVRAITPEMDAVLVKIKALIQIQQRSGDCPKYLY